MERYSPTLLDLAPAGYRLPRPSSPRSAPARECAGDRQIDDYVHLDATHLGKETLDEQTAGHHQLLSRPIWASIRPKRPFPVLPTAHYAMGGIPTDTHGRVVCDDQGTVVDGLYAAGECACVSVHGANRLGTNSLLDLVVFGRRAGRHIGEYVKQAACPR